MSKVAIVGDPSGTGTFTISAPNGNTNRTLVLPDEAGTVLTSASDVAASQITTALNATGSAPIYAARAWVNFNGTGTVAIRAAGNVSSITDNGTGDYTVNFTTALPDANYSVIAGAREAVDNSSTTNRVVAPRRTTSSVATTSVRLGSVYFNELVTDVESVYVAVFR